MRFIFHRIHFSLKKLLGSVSPIEQIIQQPVYKQQVFQQALNHGGGIHESYDRLEFLGDAVLETIVSEWLYKQFPEASEGKLTQMRSSLVRRSALNLLGYRIGLGQQIQSNFLSFDVLTDENKRIFGDTLEALIGAVYLNSGFVGVKHFIIDVLLKRYVKREELLASSPNHKGALHELSQKLNFEVAYETLEMAQDKTRVVLLINNQPVLTTSSRTKKRAEQKAAQRALLEQEKLFSLIEEEEEEE